MRLLSIAALLLVAACSAAPQKQAKDDGDWQAEAAINVSEAQCRQLGLTKGTQAFSDCVITRAYKNLNAMFSPWVEPTSGGGTRSRSVTCYRNPGSGSYYDAGVTCSDD